MKNFILGGISILVAVCILVLGGEIAIRLVHFYTDHFSDKMPPRLLELDEQLGWLPVPDYFYSGELVDAAGKSYPVEIKTNRAGYRKYGNVQTDSNKKVLFLGDSYTHAMQVSNDKTYYGILEKELEIEVFSIGVDGYGTLQQYMLVDKIIDEIDPGVVVLQFCPNDFINNHFDLEQGSAFNNNGLRRPYFEDNQIQYKTAASFPAIRAFAASYSEFLYFVIKTLDRLKAPPENSSESLIEEPGVSYPLFRESVEITDQLLGKIRGRISPGTQIYAFSTDHGFPYHDEFKRLSEENGMHFIDGTSQALRAAEGKGITTRAADKAHWNDRGHQIVADVLKDYFIRKQSQKEEPGS
jgi:hypothetical protein